MSTSIAELVQQLNLRPGQVVRETVDGFTAELRVLENEAPTPGLAEQVMLNDWPSFPSSLPVTVIRGEPGQAPLPDPPVIPSDEDGE